MSLEYLLSVQTSPFLIHQTINQPSIIQISATDDPSISQSTIENSIESEFPSLTLPINQPVLVSDHTFDHYVHQSITQSMENFTHLQTQLIAHFSRTRDAAILIQKVWRGYVDRAFIHSINQSALQIQRVWRGYVARRNLRVKKSSEQSMHRLNYAHYAAVRIQCVYRGYRCRSRYANYYARARYLESINQSGQQVKQEMIEYAINASINQSINEAHAQKQQFTVLTENLHHLLSTKSTPGIYQSKLGPAFNQSINQTNVEQHLHAAFAQRQKRLKSLKKSIVINQSIQQANKQSINQLNCLEREFMDSQWMPSEETGIQTINHSIAQSIKQSRSQSPMSISHSFEQMIDEEQKESLSYRSRPSSSSSNNGGTRFPPIHRSDSLKQSFKQPLDQLSPQINAPPSGRSIILDRQGKPVTVQRPKVKQAK